MKVAPTIDGTVRDDEWAGTARMERFGKKESLVPLEASFWVGSDGKELFLAVVSETPPGGKLLSRIVPLPDGRNARTWLDDSVELVLDPTPAAPAGQRRPVPCKHQCAGSNPPDRLRGGRKCHAMARALADREQDHRRPLALRIGHATKGPRTGPDRSGTAHGRPHMPQLAPDAAGRRDGMVAAGGGLSRNRRPSRWSLGTRRRRWCRCVNSRRPAGLGCISS